MVDADDGQNSVYVWLADVVQNISLYEGGASVYA